MPSSKSEIRYLLRRDPAIFGRRPLSARLLKYAAEDVVLLLAAAGPLIAKMWEELDTLKAASRQRCLRSGRGCAEGDVQLCRASYHTALHCAMERGEPPNGKRSVDTSSENTCARDARRFPEDGDGLWLAVSGANCHPRTVTHPLPVPAHASCLQLMGWGQGAGGWGTVGLGSGAPLFQASAFWGLSSPPR